MRPDGPRVLASAPAGGTAITPGGVLAALLFLVAGFALGLLLGSGEGEETGAADVDLGGVPKGIPHTESGAVNAAATYTSLFSLDALLDENRAAELAESIATPAYREDLLAQARAARRQPAIGELAEATTSGAAYGQVVPLSYRVESYSAREATIELWGLTIIGGGSIDPPTAGYARDLVTVSWEADGWRLAAVEDVGEGPTPAPEDGDPPSSTDRLLHTLREFEEYRGAGQ